ncbi:MAG: hypothetical protein HKN25_10000 [Pyrinomonadaceae bacterium]|nr:hypothetical protein [Pyrinomonadaceae bacterium]
MKHILTAVLILLFVVAPAIACDIVDQEQLMFTTTPIAIGGDSEQKLAQSFTVGEDGFLTQIRVPVACSSGELIVEIQRLNAAGEPSGAVVATARVAAEDLPSPASEFKTIEFSPPLGVVSGDQYAIVLKNPTGTCVILKSAEGDNYAGGQYFYDSRPNRPGWVGGRIPAPMGTAKDLPFQTVVDNGRPCGGGRSNICFGTFGAGRIPLPISADVPLCSCLSEGSLNSFRCRLIHPDFFVIRRVTFPRNATGRMTERWSFTPLASLNGPVKMSFRGDGTKPIVRVFGKRSRPGKFETFRFVRKINQAGKPVLGKAMFSYPTKKGVSPFQAEFGFDADLPVLRKLKLGN